MRRGFGARSRVDDSGFEEEELGQRGKCADLGGERAEEADGLEAGWVKVIEDVFSEIGTDGCGGKSDVGGPLADKRFDVFEAVDAGLVEVVDKGLACLRVGERCGTCGPDGGDPRQAGVAAPKGSYVVPFAEAGSGFDVGALLKGEQGGVADEKGGVGMGEHGDGVGGVVFEGGLDVEEMAEEDLGVGYGRAGGGVGGDGADLMERELGDELDGADVMEAGDGAAGYDAESGGESGDGDETEISGAGVEIARALRGSGEVDIVALSEGGGERRVVEVPHEGCGIEEVDCRYAKSHRVSVRGHGSRMLVSGAYRMHGV